METPNPRPRLTPHDLDSIRASINGFALFEGLGLCKAERKSKPNDWWALSPFHDEKTPSFHMRPDGVWYDFSIGKGGGPIELIEQLYSYNCYQAGQYILDNGWAQKATMEPDVKSNTNHVKQQVKSQTKPNAEVSATHQNKPIRQDLLPMTDYHDYLRTRGLSEATCQALGIGYRACRGLIPTIASVMHEIIG
jgi:DNA primase